MHDLDALVDENIKTTANIICLEDQFQQYDKTQFGVQIQCKDANTGEILLNEVVVDPVNNSREDAEEILTLILFELEKARKQSTALQQS